MKKRKEGFLVKKKNLENGMDSLSNDGHKLISLNNLKTYRLTQEKQAEQLQTILQYEKEKSEKEGSCQSMNRLVKGLIASCAVLLIAFGIFSDTWTDLVKGVIPLQDGQKTEGTADITKLTIEPITIEKDFGEFNLYFHSEKNVYTTEERVNVYAEITYIGSKDVVEIEYTLYPLYFFVWETEREINIPVHIPVPPETHRRDRVVGSKTLENGVAYKETYVKPNSVDTSGIHGEFLKKFRPGSTFPVGQYEMRVIVDFIYDGEEYDFEVNMPISVVEK